MIIKAALILVRHTGSAPELMQVRPHGKNYYVFPGGKQETGETIEQALLREIHEELNCSVDQVKPIGTVIGHTPDGRDLTMQLFTGHLVGQPQASSEIAEVIWLSRADVKDQIEHMTPISLGGVLPFLEKERIF